MNRFYRISYRKFLIAQTVETMLKCEKKGVAIDPTCINIGRLERTQPTQCIL